MAATWTDVRKTLVQYTGNRMQRQKIKKTALEREGPFKTKPPKGIRTRRGQSGIATRNNSNIVRMDESFREEGEVDWMDNDWVRHFY